MITIFLSWTILIFYEMRTSQRQAGERQPAPSRAATSDNAQHHPGRGKGPRIPGWQYK